MDYKKYNDYELISMVCENDEDSYYSLFSKYEPIIKSIAQEFYRKYNCYGADYEDFVQEGYLGFQEALSNYDSNKGALFYTFVTLCIRRHLLSFVKKISAIKKNNNTNLFLPIGEFDISDDNINIDSYVDYSDVFNIVKDTIYSLKLDYSAPFELRMNNFTYREISILLDVPISSIDYKIKYVRKYLKNELRKLDNQ